MFTFCFRSLGNLEDSLIRKTWIRGPRLSEISFFFLLYLLERV